MQSHQNPYGGYGAYGQQSGVVQPQQTTQGYPYASAPAPPAQQPVTGYGQSAYTATAADPYGQQSYAQQGGAYSATGATYQQDASQQAAQGFAGAAGQQQYGAEYQQYQAAPSAETSYAAYGTAQTQSSTATAQQPWNVQQPSAAVEQSSYGAQSQGQAYYGQQQQQQQQQQTYPQQQQQTHDPYGGGYGSTAYGSTTQAQPPATTYTSQAAPAGTTSSPYGTSYTAPTAQSPSLTQYRAAPPTAPAPAAPAPVPWNTPPVPSTPAPTPSASTAAAAAVLAAQRMAQLANLQSVSSTPSSAAPQPTAAEIAMRMAKQREEKARGVQMSHHRTTAPPLPPTPHAHAPRAPGDRSSGGGGGYGGGGLGARPGLGASTDRPQERDRISRGPDARDRQPRQAPPPQRRYALRLTPYPLVTAQRDYQQLRTRYNRLRVGSDFSKAVVLWPEESVKSGDLGLVNGASFYRGNNRSEVELFRRKLPHIKNPPISSKTFNVRVVLFQGINHSAKIGTEENHVSRHVKFLVTKSSAKGIQCIGGPWDPEKDGAGKGDGTPDEAGLIKTACRIVKEQADVDISGCTSWFKLLEVYYTRPVEVLNGKVYPEEREQTLYIVPCLTKDMMPTEDAFTAQLVEIAEEHNKAQEKKWEEKCAELQKKRDEAAAAKEADEAKTKALLEEMSKKGDDDAPPSPPDEPEPAAEEKIPDNPSKPEPIQLDPPKSPALICRQRYDDTQESKVHENLELMSLDTLLDYSIDDDDFEVSLMAEVFNEMLLYQSAMKILSYLRGYLQMKHDNQVKSHAAQVKEKQEAKEAKEAEAAAGDAAGTQAEAGAGDKRKSQEAAGGEAKKVKTEAGDSEWVGGEEFEVVSREEATAEEMFHEEEVVDHVARAAWQFVDKAGAGQVRVDDMEMLLHNLGARLTRRQVEHLVDSASSAKQGVMSGRWIDYRKLTSTIKYVFDGTKACTAKKAKKEEAGAKDGMVEDGENKETAKEGEAKEAAAATVETASANK